MLLSIKHSTVYRYATAVFFQPHQLMLRPIEGRDVQIRSWDLSIRPAHGVRWVRDVFGNAVGVVDFLEPADSLAVESTLLVEQSNTNPFDFVLEPHALEIPFCYAGPDSLDVMPYLHRERPQDEQVIREWVRPFLTVDGQAKTLEFLTALNRSVPMTFQYARREEPGVQTPEETLRQRKGSCRDFAFLFMEMARQLGIAARFVSGYLCQSKQETHEAARGATHAWVEVFLPGAGWKGFDPTCGILAADHHVRVAVVRNPSQAPPVSGSFFGNPSAFLRMEVTVHAHVVPSKSE